MAQSSYDALRDQNRIPVAMGQSNADTTQTLPFLIDHITGRVLVDSSAAGSVTVYNDTVSGIINSSNVTFTVPNAVTFPIALFLAGMPYQVTTDYTVSGTTITFVTAPDISLSGQPFWLAHT